jgi:hypothetical protein
MADDADTPAAEKPAPKPRAPRKPRATTKTRAAASDSKPAKRVSAKAAEKPASKPAAKRGKPAEPKGIAATARGKADELGAATRKTAAKAGTVAKKAGKVAKKAATSRTGMVAGAVTALGMAAVGFVAGVAAVRKRTAAAGDTLSGQATPADAPTPGAETVFGATPAGEIGE